MAPFEDGSKHRNLSLYFCFDPTGVVPRRARRGHRLSIPNATFDNAALAHKTTTPHTRAFGDARSAFEDVLVSHLGAQRPSKQKNRGEVIDRVLDVFEKSGYVTDASSFEPIRIRLKFPIVIPSSPPSTRAASSMIQSEPIATCRMPGRKGV